MAIAAISLKQHEVGGSAPRNQLANVAVPLEFWRFFADRQTEVIFQFRAPSDLASGSALKLIYDTIKGETGDIRLTVEVMCVSDGELANAASFDTANAATDTVEATVGKINALSITLTNADSITAGDLVLIRLRRTPAHASDTCNADMRLFEADFEYTTT